MSDTKELDDVLHEDVRCAMLLAVVRAGSASSAFLARTMAEAFVWSGVIDCITRRSVTIREGPNGDALFRACACAEVGPCACASLEWRSLRSVIEERTAAELESLESESAE